MLLLTSPLLQFYVYLNQICFHVQKVVFTDFHRRRQTDYLVPDLIL